MVYRRFLLDTSAIIDFLHETKRGARVKGLLSDSAVFCSTITVHELTKKLLEAQKNREEISIVLSSLHAFANVVPVSTGLARRAAELRFKYTAFSMADGLILATAEETGAVLVTSDQDFRERGVRETPVLTL